MFVWHRPATIFISFISFFGLLCCYHFLHFFNSLIFKQQQKYITKKKFHTTCFAVLTHSFFWYIRWNLVQTENDKHLQATTSWPFLILVFNFITLKGLTCKKKKIDPCSPKWGTHTRGDAHNPKIIHRPVGKNPGLQLNFHHSLLYFSFSICMSYDGRRVLVQY